MWRLVKVDWGCEHHYNGARSTIVDRICACAAQYEQGPSLDEQAGPDTAGMQQDHLQQPGSCVAACTGEGLDRLGQGKRGHPGLAQAPRVN